jgi:hypothetical protein
VDSLLFLVEQPVDEHLKMYPNHHNPAAFFHQHPNSYSYLPTSTSSGNVMTDASAQSLFATPSQQTSPVQQTNTHLPTHHYSGSVGSNHSSPISDDMATFSQQAQRSSISPASSSHPLPSSAAGRNRRGSPVSMDAPTQPRRYASSSTTSRKDVPAFFARRRAPYPTVSDGEEDELTEEPLAANATDQEKIEWRRRQNTLAARRSRKRKMAHQNYLEETVERLNRENETWRTRAEMLKSLLSSHGIPCPDWT